MERLKAYVKGVDDNNKDVFTVVASSDAVDREGESIKTTGWELDNFKRNPVLLWSHNAHQLPIGKVTDIAVEGGNLVAKFMFAAHDFAQDVKKLVQDKILNAVSVGFMPKDQDEKGNITKQELLELSIVNVPANQDALMLNSYKSFKGKYPTECAKTPKELIEVFRKEGRIISEKNRTIMRNTMTAMEQATEGLKELLDATVPPSREESPKPKSKPTPKKRVLSKEERVVRALKLVDRAVEVAIHETKGGGEKHE